MSFGLEYLSTATYNMVAATVLLGWDHCLTLDAEVQLIWRAKWNWVTALFIVIRYLALTNTIVGIIVYVNLPGTMSPSHTGCVAWFWFDVSSILILFICVDILLTTRVYAFYAQSRAILAGLVLLTFGSNLARIAILSVAADEFDIIASPPGNHLHFPACTISAIPPAMSYAWIPEFVPETILFLLVLFKVLQSEMRSNVPATRVFVVLIRDGTWAFMLIFGLLMMAVIGFRKNPEVGLIAVTWVVPVLGFCSSRLILNLRSAAEDQGPGRHLQTQNFELELNSVSSCVLPTFDVGGVTTEGSQAKGFGRKKNN